MESNAPGPFLDKLDGDDMGLPRLRALVVEDETSIAQYLVDTLEDFGYEVISVTTVEAALAAAQLNPDFAVAFVDLGLPDRSGLELVSELRRLSPTLQIVFATGHADKARLDMETSSTLFPILEKPFKHERLETILRGML